MKYTFFGSPRFAAIILEKLIAAGLPPALVVCNPDRPVGRKKIITPPTVKARIMNYESGIRDKIKIIQPEKLASSLFMLPDSRFDFAVVAAYSQILPLEIIKNFKLGMIGVHPSLLPQYRGATPIQSVILNGEIETGATLFLIDEKVDHGPILENRKQKIENNDNYETLEKKLAELSADLLIETLPKFIKSEIRSKPQNEKFATLTKKFSAEDAFIEPTHLVKAQEMEGKSAAEIDRKIRAFQTEPGAWTIIKEKRTKLLEAEIVDGKLKLKKIQIEGKKPTSV